MRYLQTINFPIAPHWRGRALHHQGMELAERQPRVEEGRPMLFGEKEGEEEEAEEEGDEEEEEDEIIDV